MQFHPPIDPSFLYAFFVPMLKLHFLHPPRLVCFQLVWMMQRNSHLPSEQIDELPADSASVPEKSTFLERFFIPQFYFLCGFHVYCYLISSTCFHSSWPSLSVFFLSFFVLAWLFLLHSHNHSFNAWYPNLHGWGKDAFCCMRFKFIFRSFLFSFVCFSEYCVRSVKVYIKISHLISIQTKSHCTTAKAILSLEYPYFHVLENGPITARRIFVFRDYLSVVPTRHCADEINVATLTCWWYFHSECLTVLWRVTFSFRVLLQLAQLSGSAPSLESEQVVQRRCTLDRECRKRTQDTRFLQSRPFFSVTFLIRSYTSFMFLRLRLLSQPGCAVWNR